MKRSSIKTTFGGEVAFTKFISEDSPTQERLLESLNLAVEDGYIVKPEDPTLDSKRVDLTVQDSEGNMILVIESQDATGWLDSVHASKIMYYMWDKGCSQGVILTEDADEYIMSFVRTLNTDHNFSITLLKTLIYQTDKPFVDFVPLIRGSDIEYSSNVRPKGEPDLRKVNIIQELANSNPGLFTNVTGKYVSHNIKVGANSINVGIHAYSNGKFWVDVYHNGKINTDAFRNTFTTVCEENNYESKFQQARGYVNGNGGFESEEAIRIFKIFVEAVKTNKINA